jgi:hypothetical protein
MPLQVANEVIAVLEIGNTTDKGSFTPEASRSS